MAEMKKDRPKTFGEFTPDDTYDFNEALEIGLKAAAIKGFEQRANNLPDSIERAKRDTFELIHINLRYFFFKDAQAYRTSYIDNPIEDMFNVLKVLGFKDLLKDLQTNGELREQFGTIMNPILEEALNEIFVVPAAEA